MVCVRVRPTHAVGKQAVRVVGTYWPRQVSHCLTDAVGHLTDARPRFDALSAGGYEDPP